MGIENHGQRFPAALGVPENAVLAVRLCRMSGGGNRLFDGKILMISGKDFERILSVHIEADKVEPVRGADNIVVYADYFDVSLDYKA